MLVVAAWWEQEMLFRLPSLLQTTHVACYFSTSHLLPFSLDLWITHTQCIIMYLPSATPYSPTPNPVVLIVMKPPLTVVFWWYLQPLLHHHQAGSGSGSGSQPPCLSSSSNYTHACTTTIYPSSILSYLCVVKLCVVLCCVVYRWLVVTLFNHSIKLPFP